MNFGTEHFCSDQNRYAFQHLIELFSDCGISFCSLNRGCLFQSLSLMTLDIDLDKILYFQFAVNISIREFVLLGVFLFHKHIFFILKNKILQHFRPISFLKVWLAIKVFLAGLKKNSVWSI